MTMEREMKKEPKITKGQAAKRRRTRNERLRLVLQLIFFVSMPGCFVAGFSGVKYIFRQIGTGQPLEINSFIIALILLSAFTILFGRFFCGFVCAFGSLGDFVYRLSGFLQKKVLKRRKQFGFSEKAVMIGQKCKYLVLTAIVVTAALGLYDRFNSWNPWSAFSFFMSFRLKMSGYAGGLLLLILIVIGMAFQERFFCQFLCPMGAVFALLPQIPFAQLYRDPEKCIKGCRACKNQCPVKIKLEPDGFLNGECIGCERCADVCPCGNLSRWDRKILKNEAIAVVVKALVFLLLGAAAGLCRFFTLPLIPGL